MNYRGSCHCGTIAYEVEGDLDQVIQCNCSLCSRRGWLLWFVPRDRLALKTPASAMHTYTFNTHRLQHHFCPTCGCAPFSEGIGPDGQARAAVNARCLEDIDASALPVQHYDGRNA
ncbi:TPA: GFA family protein [Pseudomonas aeruginosa]|uniref:GFA family protein n=1 Tax=Pseudomonas TaxID=286 RepID=UPI0003BAD2D6|nr:MULTISPECIES: GFA family protein [Pseudomonas]HCL2780260.1 GFA family protein [Pseudomonas aeruginosa AC9A]AHC77880.1 Gfa-like protein [Pseudomonas aeruginosa SCV20265]EIU2715264.1 GFA family protein [Pseudomonas aeruginosa]EIU2861099.1 GFA family protein [Pseudomonas aeruginosa]EKJ8724214.1 GFA family protein [Pseudomonas aeruginosa]